MASYPRENLTPEFGQIRSATTCSYCGARAIHEHRLTGQTRFFGQEMFARVIAADVRVWYQVSHITCIDCQGQSIFVRPFEDLNAVADHRQLLPTPRVGPAPHDELPQEVRVLFLEAQSVGELSPRSASALLRVALETFLAELGFTSGRLIDRIDEASRSELLRDLFQALDVVRVVGNEAAHESIVDLAKDPEVVIYLFDVINEIAEEAIARPRRRSEMYNKLPESKKRSEPDPGG